MPISKDVVTAPWVARVLFLSCLLVLAIVIGVSAWCFTTNSEQNLSDRQFDVLATQALGEFVGYVERKQLSLVAMASVAAELQPDPDQWPFVFLPNFEVIVRQLLQATSGDDMGFVPLVLPEQRQEWLNFAYTYYNTTREPEPFPPGTAVSPFGIWGMRNGTKFASVNGTTPDTNSPYTYLAPVFHADEGVTRALLFDHRSDARRRQAVDTMLSCAENSEKISPSPESHCTGLTQTVDLVKYDKDGPSSILYQYIQPRTATSPTGMIVSPLVWIDIMREGLAPSSVHGMDVILTATTPTEEFHFAYTIQYGEPIYLGPIDDEDHEHTYKHTIRLTGANSFAPGSPEYRICLYPTSYFAEIYETNNPKLATIGSAVLVVLLTSLFFFLYDRLMRKQVNHQATLLQAKRQFMRFVSHEVRTPINSISMGMHVMQQEIARALGYKTAEELEQKLIRESRHNVEEENKTKNIAITSTQAFEWFGLTRDILTNSEVATDVLSDFLDFDKIQSGSLQLEWTEVPIWDIVTRTVHEFKLPANAKDIELVVLSHICKCSKDLEQNCCQKPKEIQNMTVLGDPGRLTQVLRNLLSNAIKFCQGGSTINVALHWTTEPNGERKTFDLVSGRKVTLPRTGDIRISVIDTGAGLSEKQLENLFRSGVQFNVNELQAGKGSGLGLHISKGIMEQHRGSLTAESKGLGQGATFTMGLPLYEKTTSNEKTETTRESGSTEPGHRINSLRFLVVDDSSFNRKFLTRLLENNGHEVVQAEDGVLAVDKVRESIDTGLPFDTILLDYEMPRMNGPDAARAIRNLECDVFIVAITGNMLQEDVQLFLSCGANVVLPKPLKMPRLEEVLAENHVVGRQNTGRESTLR